MSRAPLVNTRNKRKYTQARCHRQHVPMTVTHSLISFINSSGIAAIGPSLVWPHRWSIRTAFRALCSRIRRISPIPSMMSLWRRNGMPGLPCSNDQQDAFNSNIPMDLSSLPLRRPSRTLMTYCQGHLVYLVAPFHHRQQSLCAILSNGVILGTVICLSPHTALLARTWR